MKNQKSKINKNEDDDFIGRDFFKSKETELLMKLVNFIKL